MREQKWGAERKIKVKSFLRRAGYFLGYEVMKP
jgi:hypothetical protein